MHVDVVSTGSTSVFSSTRQWRVAVAHSSTRQKWAVPTELAAAVLGSGTQWQYGQQLAVVAAAGSSGSSSTRQSHTVAVISAAGSSGSNRQRPTSV